MLYNLLMDLLYCQKSDCLCHHLCPSGHFIYPPNQELTGCTYVSFINRHLIAENVSHEEEELEFCLCNQRCGLSRSGGIIRIKIIDDKFYIVGIWKD